MRQFVIINVLLMISIGTLKCQNYEMNIVEESATFMGQDLKYFLSNFVMTKINYPKSALENCIHGKVIVQFAIDSNGKITDVKILRGLDPECDQEAIRVIKLSGGMWTPGKSKGKNVKQLFALPVPFILSLSDCN